MIVVVAVVSCVHVMLEYSIGVMVSVLIVVCSGRVLALCIILSEYCCCCCIAIFKVKFGIQPVVKVFQDKKGLLLEDCMSVYACVLSVHVV